MAGESLEFVKTICHPADFNKLCLLGTFDIIIGFIITLYPVYFIINRDIPRQEEPTSFIDPQNQNPFKSV